MITNKGHFDIRLFIINKLLSQDIYIKKKNPNIISK